MSDNGEKKYIEIEDELNIALSKIGKETELDNSKVSMDEKISNITVEDLLKELKTDEFEKIYISSAVQSNSFNNELNDINKIQNMAEYQLSQMKNEDKIDNKTKDSLKSASNFYLIPHLVNQRYNVGKDEKVKEINFYTVNDVDGYSLYTIIGDNITLSTGFKNKIENYLKENYMNEIKTGDLKIDEIVEDFTPHNIEELYEKVGDDYSVTMRFLPTRIDEIAKEKGFKEKDIKEKQFNLKENDNLVENNKINLNYKVEDSIEKEEVDKQDNYEENEHTNIEKKKEDREEKEEINELAKYNYIERIAKMNHVNPAVVNTRVIKNLSKVEEDLGIHLQQKKYPFGVIAVRLPYKLGYRTFLVDPTTCMTIDGKGVLDGRPGKFYDYDEIEDYFRYRLRSGEDGGDAGKPLKYDERRSYTTYIDEHGDVKEKKFINNGKKQDMLREERERYLIEVEEIDRRLADAIEEYQKNANNENYKKVKDIIQEKFNIDNKYNALDNQREVTEETKNNTERIIQKDLDDDNWFPSR